MTLAKHLVGLLILCAVLTSGVCAQSSSSATQRVTFGIIRTAAVHFASSQNALVQQGEIALQPQGARKMTVGTDGKDEMSIEGVEREGRVSLATVSSLADLKGIQRLSKKKSPPLSASSVDLQQDPGAVTITLTD